MNFQIYSLTQSNKGLTSEETPCSSPTTIAPCRPLPKTYTKLRTATPAKSMSFTPDWNALYLYKNIKTPTKNCRPSPWGQPFASPILPSENLLFQSTDGKHPGLGP